MTDETNGTRRFMDRVLSVTQAIVLLGIAGIAGIAYTDHETVNASKVLIEQIKAQLTEHKRERGLIADELKSSERRWAEKEEVDQKILDFRETLIDHEARIRELEKHAPRRDSEVIFPVGCL